jgi:DNA-binding IclR family transcriptional regulator
MSTPTSRLLTSQNGDQRVRQRSPLARALRALDYLRDRPCTAVELAEFLGVNRSTAHRLLGELQAAGYVLRDPVARRFDLAPDKLRASAPDADAGHGPFVEGEWTEALSGMLGKLRDIAGEATMFAVPARDRMLYAAFFPTGHPIGVQESIGSVRPMHASAIGKAYLSALDEETFDVVLGRLAYREGTDRAAKGPFQLRDMIADVRRLGYAVDHDETFEGLSCVATPVSVGDHILVGAAGVTGPTHRFTADRVQPYADFLVRNARHLNVR